jgi:hypothetical protein
VHKVEVFEFIFVAKKGGKEIVILKFLKRSERKVSPPPVLNQLKTHCGARARRLSQGRKRNCLYFFSSLNSFAVIFPQRATTEKLSHAGFKRIRLSYVQNEPTSLQTNTLSLQRLPL